MSSTVPGLYEWGKKFAVFMTIMSALDSAIVIAATASGIKLPSYAYFAPPQLVNYLYNFTQSMSNMTFTNLYAFFIFIIAIDAVVLLANFIIGVIAGGPLLAWGLANAAGNLPGMVGLAAAATAILMFIQAVAMIYVLYVFLGITLP
jgi:hypothetical protein